MSATITLPAIVLAVLLTTLIASLAIVIWTYCLKTVWKKYGIFVSFVADEVVGGRVIVVMKGNSIDEYTLSIPATQAAYFRQQRDNHGMTHVTIFNQRFNGNRKAIMGW